MAFFDDFKKSATDVADKVAKKTTDFTSIARIAMNIRSNESKLSSTYEEIGYLFYTAERNGTDYTEEIAAQILKADGLNAEIESLKKESAKLRNVKICSGCQKEIPSDSSFCSFCGLKQDSYNVEETLFDETSETDSEE